MRRIAAMLCTALIICMFAHTAFAEKIAPEWVYTNLLELSAAKLLELPPGINSTNIHSLTRQEMSQLIAQAMQKTGKRNNAAPVAQQ